MPKNNTHHKSNTVKTNKKTNTLSIVGFIAAFLVPIAGLVCSIVALVQIKKSREKGKRLAIVGAIISAIHLIIEVIVVALLVFFIITSLFSSGLSQYKNAELGYGVQYPKGWQVSEGKDGKTSIVTIKKESKEAGKLYGAVAVAAVLPPANSYKKDILDTIATEIKNKNDSTVIVDELRKQNPPYDTLTLVTTYNAKNEQIKAKTTIIKDSNGAVYVVSTQAPLKYWEKYKNDFNKIHDTFSID